ncbi:MAG TPA: TolC family protein [Gemmatimonadaceae bacterium]|nr:TolC family protein [Gemmatimonadaceae bacterium]
MHRSTIPALFLGVLLAVPASAQDTTQPRTLSLDQALALANESNAGLRAVRQRVEEAERRNRVVFSNFLPRVSTMGGYLGSDNTRGILLPAGSMGNVPGLGPFPPADRNIPQGGSSIGFAVTTLTQPVTQYFKIREGMGVSRADESVSRAEVRRVEQQVAFGVLRAYAGLLIAERRRDAARERVEAATARTTIQNTAVQSGIATQIASSEGRLRVLQARQELLAAENELIDLTYALSDAIGLSQGTKLVVEAPPPLTGAPSGTADEYLASALRSHPDILEAEAIVSKATHGVGAAKTDFIPSVGLFGSHFYQSSIPFFPKNTLFFGAIGSVTILDFGARRNTLAERNAQLAAAQRNLERVNGKVRGEVEAAYRKLGPAMEMVALAREALTLRAEALRLRTVSTTAGYGVPAEQREASADKMDADLNVLKAELGYRIAVAELEMAAGRLGGNAR